MWALGRSRNLRNWVCSIERSVNFPQTCSIGLSGSLKLEDDFDLWNQCLFLLFSTNGIAGRTGSTNERRERGCGGGSASRVEASRAPEAVLGGGGAVGPVSECNDHPWWWSEIWWSSMVIIRDLTIIQHQGDRLWWGWSYNRNMVIEWSS